MYLRYRHDRAKDFKSLHSWKIGKAVLHMCQGQWDAKDFLGLQMCAINQGVGKATSSFSSWIFAAWDCRTTESSHQALHPPHPFPQEGLYITNTVPVPGVVGGRRHFIRMCTPHPNLTFCTYVCVSFLHSLNRLSSDSCWNSLWTWKMPMKMQKSNCKENC